MAAAQIQYRPQKHVEPQIIQVIAQGLPQGFGYFGIMRRAQREISWGPRNVKRKLRCTAAFFVDGQNGGNTTGSIRDQMAQLPVELLYLFRAAQILTGQIHIAKVIRLFQFDKILVCFNAV